MRGLVYVFAFACLVSVLCATALVVLAGRAAHADACNVWKASSAISYNGVETTDESSGCRP